MGIFSRLFRSKPTKSEREPRVPAADAGRLLRQQMLGISAAQADVEPTQDFPHAFAVLMDWHLGDAIATVFATSTGAASLYTTSTFGIIGGEFHEKVRYAAMNFTHVANRYFPQAQPVSAFPYPSADRVYFYLLTFVGVRRLEWDIALLKDSTSDCYLLFAHGQQVLTELRKVWETRTAK